MSKVPLSTFKNAAKSCAILKDMPKEYWVYIVTNKTRTTLYIGVTNDLQRRVYEHRNELSEGFTKRYKLHHLVFYEACNNITAAILREKQLKKWRRKWKEELIAEQNPGWEDLSSDWF